jgi:hypothetical protein
MGRNWNKPADPAIKAAKEAHWAWLGTGVGAPQRRKEYKAEHARLVASGFSGDDAFIELTKPGAKYAMPRPGPEGPAICPEPAPSVIDPGVQVVGQPKDYTVRRARIVEEQDPFRRALCDRAGKKAPYRDVVEWAGNWLAIAWDAELRVIYWERISEDPPTPMAVAMLMSACADPEKFFNITAKNTLGKGGELGDDLLVRERKREEDLLARLDELDAELEARGEDAYT